MKERRLTVTIRFDVADGKEVGQDTMPAIIEDAVVEFTGVLHRAGYPPETVHYDMSYDYHRFTHTTQPVQTLNRKDNS